MDPGTGDVELLDYLVVEDVGRIVNPLTLHGHVIGATVQGLGGPLLEDLKIRGISLGHKPSPGNPLGVKGASEGGLSPSPG